MARRLDILRLHPITQAELCGSKPRLITKLLSGDWKAGVSGVRQGKDLARGITRGGYPAALARSSAHRQAAWYRDYVETLI
ncbi:MAG: hypothetical protein SGI98_05225 [Verrucomicrobiota bacterium]|nr:hypothetical protein [Verrucomicrobiota bacterium]